MVDLARTLTATLSPVSTFRANLTLAKVPSPIVLSTSYFPTFLVTIPPYTVPLATTPSSPNPPLLPTMIHAPSPSISSQKKPPKIAEKSRQGGGICSFRRISGKYFAGFDRNWGRMRYDIQRKRWVG